MNAGPAILEWLLERDDMSVRYRALSELLDRGPKDSDVKQAKAAIPGSPAVSALFAAMRPDGSWRCRCVPGQGYGHLNFALTSLSWAAELGLDRSDERVARAVEFVFSLQHEDGDFNRHYSCLNGLILRTLNRLGYGRDPRAVRLRKLLLRSSRHDGGFHCDMRPRRRKDATPHKSCIRGSLEALLAFAEDEALCGTEQAQRLVDYFLRRHVFFRTDDLTRPVLRRAMRLSFPFTFMPGLLEPIYALSRLGYGNRPEMKEAWALLESKRDDHGRLPLERSVAWPHIQVAPRRRPNKWLTLYACLAEKARDAIGNPQRGK